MTMPAVCVVAVIISYYRRFRDIILIRGISWIDCILGTQTVQFQNTAPATIIK